jgi:D-3-phosphoglycerate dehydrogenase / 2-oxoglutarate reductase
VTQTHMRRGQFYNTFGSELLDRRLLLLGFGASARELAVRARPFGMRISAIDIYDIGEKTRREFGLEAFGRPEDLDRMLPECDFLSLHLHLNASTRGIIDRRRLQLLNSEAHLINVARGALVDEAALYDALASGKLAGAGLDVFASEPMDPNSPLLDLPNVVATPHISGSTYGTSRRRALCVAENIERIAMGLEPLYRVDRPALQPALAAQG